MTTILNSNTEQELSPAKQDNQTKIWASMGLCYSHNTHKYGKENYPYKQVIPLALLLWRYHLPQVNTIVRIVHTEPELTANMSRYGAMLQRAGRVVHSHSHWMRYCALIHWLTHNLGTIMSGILMCWCQLSYAIKKQLKTTKAPYSGHFVSFIVCLWHSCAHAQKEFDICDLIP